MSMQPGQQPQPQQYQQPQMPAYPHYPRDNWGGQMPSEGGGIWDQGTGQGLGSLLNFGLLGLLNGKSPLLNPGILLNSLGQGQQMQNHNRLHQQNPYYRPMAQQVPTSETPPIVPQQPPIQGGY